MKTKYILHTLALTSILGGLSGCYRDDVNYLYSEQYINDGNRELVLHPLQAKYSNSFGHYDEQTNTLYVTPESTVRRACSLHRVPRRVLPSVKKSRL